MNIMIALAFAGPIALSGCAITAHVKDGKAHLTGYGAEKVEYYPDGKIKSLSKHPPFEMPQIDLD